MGIHFDGDGSGGMAFLAVLTALFSIFVTIFWMVVGWRAMKAHEKIASSVRRIAARGGRDEATPGLGHAGGGETQ